MNWKENEMCKLSIKINEEQSDIWFVWSYALCLCVEPLRYLLSLIGITGGTATILSLIIVYLPMLIGSLIRKKILLDFAVLLLLILTAFSVTLLLYPQYKYVIFSSSYSYSAVSQILTPFGGVFMFLFVRNIKDMDKGIKPFIVAMSTLFLYHTLTAIMSGGVWIHEGSGKETIYSMSFSYNILLPVLTFFTYGLRRKKVLPIIVALFGSMEILIYGSRGALLAVCCYFILYVLWIWLPKNNKNKVLFTLGIIIVTVLVLMFGDTLFRVFLSNLGNALSEFGFSSRTLSTLINSANRTEDRFTIIWPATIKLITQNLVIGKGLYAAHYHLGIFCHNFILEILLDFGIIIGGVILYFISKSLRFVFTKCKDETWRNYFLIIIPFWFSRLMFSSSFWYEGTFWAFLAAVISYRNYSRLKNSLERGNSHA